MGRGRAPCCDKNNVKKGPWSPSEDSRLTEFITMQGHTNWRALPNLAGLKRCGKSCRLRWINYLRPDVRRGNFSPQEELTIINLHNSFGNKWSKIASYLPGRTDNEIKNVWNTHLKKRLANPNLVHHHHHGHETNEPKQSSTTNYSASPSSTSTNSTTSPLGVALKNPNLKPDDHDHPTSDSPTSSGFSAMHPAADDGKIEIPVDSDINIWELFESLEDHENTTETNEVDEQVWKVEYSKWIGLLEDELGLTSDANQTWLKDQNMNSPLEPEIIGPGFDYFPLWPSSPQNL